MLLELFRYPHIVLEVISTNEVTYIGAVLLVASTGGARELWKQADFVRSFNSSHTPAGYALVWD